MVACGVLSPLGWGWFKRWGTAGCGERLAARTAPPGGAQGLGAMTLRTSTAADDGTSATDRGRPGQAALLRSGSDDRPGSNRRTIGNECGGTWMAIVTSSLGPRAL